MGNWSSHQNLKIPYTFHLHLQILFPNANLHLVHSRQTYEEVKKVTHSCNYQRAADRTTHLNRLTHAFH